MAAAFQSDAFQNDAFEIGGVAPTVHATSGVLAGPGSSIVGSASNFTVHATSGVLAGQTATIVGAADREAAAIPHTTTGALVGQGSTATGSATRFRAHASSGVLAGQGAIIVGDADHEVLVIPHISSGILVGQGSALSGSAFVSHLHATTGTLIGSGAEIAGDAELTPYVPTVHDTDGNLVGSGAIIVGDATLIDPPQGGGGPGNAVSVQPRKQKGWANERAQFEQSQDDIGRIAQTLTESEQPQVQRIARKLVDYTGEIEQIASLQRELEKLESAKISRLLDAERNQEIKAALNELNEILQDDEDAAEALLMLHEIESRQIMAILALR